MPTLVTVLQVMGAMRDIEQWRQVIGTRLLVSMWLHHVEQYGCEGDGRKTSHGECDGN